VKQRDAEKSEMLWPKREALAVLSVRPLNLRLPVSHLYKRRKGEPAAEAQVSVRSNGCYEPVIYKECPRTWRPGKEKL